MILTPTTKAAARVAAQLERRIFERLDGDPTALALFRAYASLMDSLAGGTAGEPLGMSFDDLVAGDMQAAQQVLADLERRGTAHLRDRVHPLELPEIQTTPAPGVN